MLAAVLLQRHTETACYEVQMRAIKSIQQPLHTGENRCFPCTVINITLAFVTSIVIALILMERTTEVISVVISGCAFVSSVIIVWLRGYIVPGTPTITKRYMPNKLLRLFGKPSKELKPQIGGIGKSIKSVQINLQKILMEARAIEPCLDTDDLCLSGYFARQWDDTLDAIGEYPDPEIVIDVFGFNFTNINFNEHGGAVSVRSGNRLIGKWPSRTALRIDIAGCQLLSSMVPDWGELTPHERSQIVAGLRIFLEKCPGGGPVKLQEETVESCCSSHEVVSLICSESGERLLELPAD